MTRSRMLLWFCPVAAAALLTGCGGSTSSTSTGTSTDTTVTTTATTTAATETAPDVATFAATFQNGKVTGDTEPSVPRGTAVEIRVTSDVADEAHLHGYDIEKEIAAGETVTFAFTADLPGKYSLELHHHSTRLLTLTVT